MRELHRELLRDKKMTGNLHSFKESLLKESSVSSYEKRLDEAILSMCDQLDTLIKVLWSNLAVLRNEKAESRCFRKMKVWLQRLASGGTTTAMQEREPRVA